MESNIKKLRKKVWISLALAALLLLAAFLSSVAAVRLSARDAILTMDEAAAIGADCVLVLGAGVRDGGTPSGMLADRLDIGIAAYEAGVSGKLLMSGDHGRMDYDEVNTMKDYAVRRGVPSCDVFMDHAGFSTYESMYRARDVFQAETVVIVTQSYHLPRAIYIARSLGLTAYGVSADLHTYGGQSYFNFREVLAQAKDFFKCIVKPRPTYLGDAIPVSGDGDATNDR